jgi:hypothetical protein
VPASVIRFDESWENSGENVGGVHAVLAGGELPPIWWKSVELEAERLGPPGPPKVGGSLRARARRFAPYELNFILEAAALEPDRFGRGENHLRF